MDKQLDSQPQVDPQTIEDELPEMLAPSASLLEHEDDDIESFLAWFPAPIKPLPGPLAPCQVLSASSLEPYEAISDFRTIELAYELLQRGPYGLADILGWVGSDAPGILSLYYQGPLEMYRLLGDPRSRLPLIVASGDHIIERLQGFIDSLQQAGLGLENFTARILPLPGNLHLDARRRLLESYRPVWNVFDGLGARQNAPDSRGARSVRSRWDSLHPGRRGAGRLARTDNVRGQLELEIPRSLIRYHRVERLLQAYETLVGGL